MGKPNRHLKSIIPQRAGSVPAEVKHFSKRRKRERKFIPLVAASEEGRAQTNFYNWGCKEILSGAFVLKTNVPEGEQKGKVLKEIPWKGIP